MRRSSSCASRRRVRSARARRATEDSRMQNSLHRAAQSGDYSRSTICCWNFTPVHEYWYTRMQAPASSDSSNNLLTSDFSRILNLE